ncbi:glycosyltransferase family 90 protein [Calocera cornea HHB12733]|uniref:Glycosyltransferase family 90 protein n=1 Tax=Calocera cornea HHB12733 TaxID=1353952 RepID=A0A165CXH4_9BASI|nr:glycosyltransferase family 90 protein [Calocera cornea HHB12733]
MDPVPANPLALLEQDRDAAYRLYGEAAIDEVLDDLYNRKVEEKKKGLFGFKGQPVTPAHLEEHLYLPNGLLLVNPRGRHPIYDLVEKAESHWKAKVDRQSRTLGQAVAEYRSRWNRYPPKGFDKWWAYVQKHKVPLPDEYDQIMRDLSPYFAYSPSDLRKLQQEQQAKEFTYTIASIPGADGKPGRLEIVSDDRSLWEDAVKEAQKEVEQALVAATGAWEATFSIHDGPQDNWNWEFGELMRETIVAGQFLDLDTKPLKDDIGWAGGCPPNTPLRTSPLTIAPPSLPNPTSAPKHFIHDHRQSMSPCLHPSHTHHVGTLSSYRAGKGPGPQGRRQLVFSLCKTELHGDIIMVPAERWQEEPEDPTPWEEKDARLLWRGSTTGTSMSPNTPWRTSQRIRLMSLLSNMNGTHPVLQPFSPAHAVGEPALLEAAWLNPLLTDVSFTKAPIQCSEGVCEELREMFEWRSRMDPADMWKYKYLLDVDGNGWSARFHHLLSSSSVVLKSTVFPEWYTDRIQPWVHYVPVQVDLSDLYDIVTFFRGDVARGGRGAHEELARKIGVQGAGWARSSWRREDMVAYTFRLFLEYGRLMNDDRGSMDFRP